MPRILIFPSISFIFHFYLLFLQAVKKLLLMIKTINKTYIHPQFEVIKIATQKMLANSSEAHEDAYYSEKDLY